jgi:cysteinyl-tRNA synthetase
MDDDFNTPVLIAVLFEAVKMVNQLKAGTEQASAETLADLKQLFDDYAFTVLGFKHTEQEGGSNSPGLTPGLMDLILNLRKSAKSNKDFSTADQIRGELSRLGIEIKDTPLGTEYKIN